MPVQPDVLRRWRDLREMLTRQLGMFETGAITLRSNGVDIAPAAMADLQDSIAQFDALICGRETAAAQPRPTR
jgi:hypothetical protein